MKVSLQEDYRRFYTLEDTDRAKALIAYMKENEPTTAKEYAEIAARSIANSKRDWLVKVHEATAVTAGNNRLEWDQLCEGSGWFDIWIEFTAETAYGFIKGGAYLTDIWGISYDDPRVGHMFVRYYREEK